MDEILFLAHRVPFPPDRGDKIRSWNLLRHLAGLGRVHLGCLADDDAEAALAEGLRAALGGRIGDIHVSIRPRSRLGAGLKALATGAPVSLTSFASPDLQRFVYGLLAHDRIGTVFAFSGQMAQFVPGQWPGRFIMDFVDMDSAKFAAYADEGRGPLAWIHRREARELLKHEVATAARADVSLFVSEAEAALFRPHAPRADVRMLANGVDLDFYSPSADLPRLEDGAGPLIVFTGQMDYLPNADAVLHFAREALPLVRRDHPAVRFAIVGRNPTAAVLRLDGRDGVIVTGAVEDIRTWLAGADVVVAPLRVARGVQNKVLEAMAMARPLVASGAAFEGIEAEPGRDLLVADGPAAQARAVAQVLADRAGAEAIGRAGRARMEQAYRWEHRLAPLSALVREPVRRAAE